MSQSPDQETGRLCLPELQQADEALDAISQRDMADYKKAIRAKVRKALKGTRKFKLNSATEMFLIICKILNNNPDTDWEFVEKEMADPWLPERIRNYPKALLKDNVVSVVRKQLRGFEEKLSGLKMEKALLLWAHATMLFKAKNAKKVFKQL